MQANVVANASDDVSGRVSIVATSSEEMQASINEIAKAANGSAAGRAQCRDCRRIGQPDHTSGWANRVSASAR